MDISSCQKSGNFQCLGAALPLRKDRNDMSQSLKNVKRPISQIIVLATASLAFLMPYSHKTSNFNFSQPAFQTNVLSRNISHGTATASENKISLDNGKYAIVNLQNARAGPDLTDVRWAGKVVSDNFSNPSQAHRVTNMHATWTVAKVDSNSGGEIVQWGGLGGWLRNDHLIQSGTSSNPGSSKAKYFAWLNIYPGHATISNTNQRIPDTMQEINGFAVNPGDKMILDITSIDSKKNIWEISLTNQTTGGFLTVDIKYPAKVHTAEWVLERPKLSSNDGGLERLPRFEHANFGNGSCPPNTNYAVIDGKKGVISQFPHKDVLMVNKYPNNDVIARPVNISGKRSCFSVKQTGLGST